MRGNVGFLYSGLGVHHHLQPCFLGQCLLQQIVVYKFEVKEHLCTYLIYKNESKLSNNKNLQRLKTLSLNSHVSHNYGPHGISIVLRL